MARRPRLPRILCGSHSKFEGSRFRQRLLPAPAGSRCQAPPSAGGPALPDGRWHLLGTPGVLGALGGNGEGGSGEERKAGRGDIFGYFYFLLSPCGSRRGRRDLSHHFPVVPPHPHTPAVGETESGKGGSAFIFSELRAEPGAGDAAPHPRSGMGKDAALSRGHRARSGSFPAISGRSKPPRLGSDRGRVAPGFGGLEERQRRLRRWSQSDTGATVGTEGG